MMIRIAHVTIPHIFEAIIKLSHIFDASLIALGLAVGFVVFAMMTSLFNVN